MLQVIDRQSRCDCGVLGRTLDKNLSTYTHTGMGSKNISISEDAYMRLRRARRHPRESFSEVIRRGDWGSTKPSAQSWLENMAAVPEVSDAILDRLEADQQNDQAPKDKWSC